MSAPTAPRIASRSAAPDARDNVLSAELQSRWRDLVLDQRASAQRAQLVEHYSWVAAISVAMAVFILGVLGVGWGSWGVVAANGWQDSHPTLVFWGMLTSVLVGTSIVVKVGAMMALWIDRATCRVARRFGRRYAKSVRSWWTGVDATLRASGRPGLRHPERALGSFVVLDDGRLVDVRTYPEDGTVWLRSGYSSWITR